MPSRQRDPSGQPPSFNGFSPEGMRLLRQIKKNNDREWFRERKSEYEALVEQPMAALVLAVSNKCRAAGLQLFPKERNPVMRIYRDIRFSKDKRPLKTHVSADLRRSFSDPNSGGLYIHISPEESLVAAGFWQPERPMLLAWREALVKNAAAVQKLQSSLLKEGLSFSTEGSLSNMPRGFQNYSREPFAPLLKLTSFIVHRPIEPSEYSSPSLVDVVVRFALGAKPFLQYGWQIGEAASVVKLKE